MLDNNLHFTKAHGTGCLDEIAFLDAEYLCPDNSGDFGPFQYGDDKIKFIMLGPIIAASAIATTKKGST